MFFMFFCPPDNHNPPCAANDVQGSKNMNSMKHIVFYVCSVLRNWKHCLRCLFWLWKQTHMNTHCLLCFFNSRSQNNMKHILVCFPWASITLIFLSRGSTAIEVVFTQGCFYPRDHVLWNPSTEIHQIPVWAVCFSPCSFLIKSNYLNSSDSSRRCLSPAFILSKAFTKMHQIPLRAVSLPRVLFLLNPCTEMHQMHLWAVALSPWSFLIKSLYSHASDSCLGCLFHPMLIPHSIVLLK